jgi:hypothetical protein
MWVLCPDREKGGILYPVNLLPDIYRDIHTGQILFHRNGAITCQFQQSTDDSPIHNDHSGGC